LCGHTAIVVKAIEDEAVKVVDNMSDENRKPVLYYDEYYTLRRWHVKAVVFPSLLESCSSYRC
jgi:hypothetical protein